MDKLRTLNNLKNIDFVADKENIIYGFSEVVKEEAIKWIKSFKSGECHTDFAADGRNGQENIEEWIEHFFNITEGDLNNG